MIQGRSHVLQLRPDTAKVFFKGHVKTHVGALISTVMILGGRSYKEVINIKEGHKGGTQI